ncbi:MAG TPA: leucyl/phenylalanyl-tRNA--protein transferase [Paenalcaligenes sp.]|nr:leucyl/phenylalanyl-tRNA--protein transferase [Paenalcaligenes sp.]
MSRTICWLNGYTPFPDPRLAADEGLLAVGGDLSFQRLLSAYAKGIFPWYNPDEPILWWSPNPRMVLFCDEFKVARSLAKKCRQVARREQNPAERRFWVTIDHAFLQVMSACASTRQETGTWIHPEMVQAYYTLHLKGYAHSIELWDHDELAAGLYGVRLGHFFFGESMFTKISDGSKIALFYLVQHLQQQGIQHIDCQQETAHLASLGARPIPRAQFLDLLDQHTKAEQSPWPSGQLLSSGEVVPFAANTHPRL